MKSLLLYYLLKMVILNYTKTTALKLFTAGVCVRDSLFMDLTTAVYDK